MLHINLLFPVSNVADKPGIHAYMHVCERVFVTVGLTAGPLPISYRTV